MKAYKNVLYDRWNKEICVRFVGDKNYTRIPYVKDYWVKDPTGKSDWTDLHGVPMIRKKQAADKDVIKTLKQGGIAVAESDLKEEVKWLHDTYDNVELTAKVEDFKIAHYDIEVSTGSKYSEKHIIKARLP